MPEVKLLLCTTDSGDSWRYSPGEFVGAITDWEEITEEELFWLSKNLGKLPEPAYCLHYLLVVKDERTIKYRVESIRKFVEEEKVKQDAEQIKRDESNRKCKETARRNKEEKERKMLEQLSKKYGA